MRTPSPNVFRTLERNDTPSTGRRGRSGPNPSPRRRAAVLTRAACEGLEQRRLLSGFVALTPEFVGGVAPAPPSAPSSLNPAVTPAVLASPPYTPAQMRSAHGVGAISFGGVAGTGAGQTIAIIDVDNDPGIISDTAQFNTFYGLQQFNVAGGPTLQVLGPDGSTNLPTDDPSDPKANGSDVEESLDVQWAHVIAPQANIVVYEAANSSIYFDPNSESGLNQAIKTARANAAVSVVSISYGGGEFSQETGLDAGLFTTPSGHQGITFLADTDDNGAPGEYPAYSPDVVAVGGTTLNINAGGSYNSETGWSGSGGGISKYESAPSYQQNLDGVNGSSTTERDIPDVSMEADPNTGIYVYDSLLGGSDWWDGAGTSLATPMWGALVSTADQGRTLAGLPTLVGRSQTLERLYTLPSSDYHDITTGNNGYAAGPGYDLVTGIGSPIANKLVNDLAFAPSDFLVTNTNDSGSGSLRQAMTNADVYGEPVTISFDIPTSDPNYSGGVSTIKPKSALPSITNGSVTIDGSTEPNASTANGGRPVVFLNGAGQSINGLVLTAAGDVVNDLGIDDFVGTLFGGGIAISGSAAAGDSVQNCLIGVGPSGTSVAGNTVGVAILNAGTNFVGNDVIGDNTDGVDVLGGSGNYVYDDSVGISAGAAVPNGTGIVLAGPNNNLYDCQVDYNTGDGLSLSGTASTGNVVQGQHDRRRVRRPHVALDHRLPRGRQRRRRRPDHRWGRRQPDRRQNRQFVDPRQPDRRQHRERDRDRRQRRQRDRVEHDRLRDRTHHDRRVAHGQQPQRRRRHPHRLHLHRQHGRRPGLDRGQRCLGQRRRRHRDGGRRGQHRPGQLHRDQLGRRVDRQPDRRALRLRQW